MSHIPWADVARRTLDVVVAGCGLIGASPILAGCAVAIKLEDGGPVLFRQERVGRHGRTFRIRKLRTMSETTGGRLVTTGNDDRITKVGRVLRKAKLDELPQLLDVVVGSMSLVGPRPEVPKYVALWPRADREVILTVRPGITDPVSVWLRNESDLLDEQADPESYYVEVLLPEKVARYREYVESRSVVSDARIVLATIAAVLRR